MMKKKKQKSVLRDWIESIVIALILALVIRTFIIQAFKIPTGSMRMTLIEGDRILVSKWRYGPRIPFTDYRIPGFSKPQRGDVIVFVYPENPKKDFIKRLIAKGGEKVLIKDGDIYINGQKVEESPIKNIYYYNRGQYGHPRDEIIVPEDHYFVLGDNSASSKDSRYWGFVPHELVVGRAEFIYWPIRRWRFIR